MYRAYWGMEFNPFNKELQEKKFYQGTDYTEMKKRLEYLRNIRGIGLFTGVPGTGKTACLRAFCRMILTAIWHILSDLKPYTPDGFLESRPVSKEKILTTSQALNLLKQRGYIIKDDPVSIS